MSAVLGRRRLNRILWGLLLILVALGWLLARESSGPPPLTPIDPDKVQAFELHYADGEPATIALERRAAGWSIRTPIEHPARGPRINSTLAILSARSEACYRTDEHTASDFGLAQPRLRLHVAERTIAFGDRAADGRRYVATDARFCLLPDHYFPLIGRGLEQLAQTTLVPSDEGLREIATPGAHAHKDGEQWRLERGSGDPDAWAANWRDARIEGFILDPAKGDHGQVRLVTDESAREWRIAAREPKPILVASDAGYGIELAPESVQGLLAPPQSARD